MIKLFAKTIGGVEKPSFDFITGIYEGYKLLCERNNVNPKFQYTLEGLSNTEEIA